MAQIKRKRGIPVWWMLCAGQLRELLSMNQADNSDLTRRQVRDTQLELCQRAAAIRHQFRQIQGIGIVVFLRNHKRTAGRPVILVVVMSQRSVVVPVIVLARKMQMRAGLMIDRDAGCPDAMRMRERKPQQAERNQKQCDQTIHNCLIDNAD